jgi:anhydro-N-acetylmuramic acid kinase
MGKIYTALGLMSGTSLDGIDASIIRTDGQSQYKSILDKYYKYSPEIPEMINKIKSKLKNFSLTLNKKKGSPLEYQKKNYDELIKMVEIAERRITILHAELANKIISEFGENVDFIGFHGQTIEHDPTNSFTKQLGDANLLSSLTKKKVVYDFRKNDMINGGEGAPLVPIFHKQMIYQLGFDLPITIINLGGIANVTELWMAPENLYTGPKTKFIAHAKDIGPGNCLLDLWIRNNSKNEYDDRGKLAEQGKIDHNILNNKLDTFLYHRGDTANLGYPSLDVNDFDVSFARGLSLEDGVATLTNFTAKIISSAIQQLLKDKNPKIIEIIICGGGRKNKILIENIKKNFDKNINIKNIDDYGVDGDFIESQAFAFLAVRSILKLPISFPNTTGCKNPTTGGEIINF